MIQNFTRTIFDPTQKEIARVNRVDGTLYLKPQIWDHLPKGEQDFVLWHEKGHLILQTKDEFQANLYAIKKYAPAHTLTNPELKARITVMQSILTPGRENDISGFTGATTQSSIGIDPISASLGAIGSIFSTLPLLGVGSASRQKEAEASAQAQGQVIAAQAVADAKKGQSYLVWGIVGGALILTALVIYLTLKK